MNIRNSKDRYAKLICGHENKRIQAISRVVGENIRALYNMSNKIVLHVYECGQKRYSASSKYQSPVNVKF